jgi:hypothetical protein
VFGLDEVFGFGTVATRDDDVTTTVSGILHLSGIRCLNIPSVMILTRTTLLFSQIS